MPSSKIHPVHAGYASYESYLLGLGPVGYWRLTETNGTAAANVIQSGNNGALAGGPPTWDTEGFLTRDSAGSCRFSGGSTDRITVANYAALYQADMTVLFWCKSDISNYTQTAFVVGEYDTAGTNRMWAIGVSVADVWAIFVSQDGDTGGGHSSSHASSISVDTSAHLFTAVVDNAAKTWDLYLDGAWQEQINATYSYTDQSSHLTIGGLDAADLPWDGLLSEVALMPSKLTAEQINAAYLIGTNGP